MNEITKAIQEWIDSEEREGRSVDIDRINSYAQLLMRRHNNTPREDLHGLSPKEMNGIVYSPFDVECVISIKQLSKEEYEQIPLIRQVLFLMRTLNEKELKLTKLGWLPLKIVAEAYSLGQPDYYIDEVFKQKRINEYEATSVWMARSMLELLGWTKIRKGMLSLTAKGKKAFADKDEAANELLRFSLAGTILHNFDGYEEEQIGNVGLAYSVWLLNRYGTDWHFADFYTLHYQQVFNLPGNYNAYESRVFKRLFYWLGIVEERLNMQVGPPFEWEYKKTPLLSLIFSFKKQ